jgi:hypothetical protein
MLGGVGVSGFYSSEFGTRLSIVIGGLYGFIVPVFSIICDSLLTNS